MNQKNCVVCPKVAVVLNNEIPYCVLHYSEKKKEENEKNNE